MKQKKKKKKAQLLFYGYMYVCMYVFFCFSQVFQRHGVGSHVCNHALGSGLGRLAYLAEVYVQYCLTQCAKEHAFGYSDVYVL